MSFRAEALAKLRPNAKWTMRGDDITWEDESQTQPTEQELVAKTAELQAEYEANQYQRDRSVAYPSIADQLDKIYHSGIDAWKADIKAVKDKFPKPE